MSVGEEMTSPAMKSGSWLIAMTWEEREGGGGEGVRGMERGGRKEGKLGDLFIHDNGSFGFGHISNIGGNQERRHPQTPKRHFNLLG